ncbi:MAG: hypothetical protein ACH349_07445, partial [Candidatus Rhabdochlamydia sp.]
KKTKTPEEEAQKKINKYNRYFKNIISGADIAVDNLPEEMPGTSAQAATIHKEAYLKLKEKLQSLTCLMKDNPLFKNERAAIILGKNAIELVKRAPKTLDPKNVIPIKMEALYSFEEITPFLALPNERKRFCHDDESTILVEEAGQAISILESIKITLLHQSSESKNSFHLNKVSRASKVSYIAFKKKIIALEKQRRAYNDATTLLSEELIQAQKELESSKQYEQECSDALKKMEATTLPSSWEEMREMMINDIIELGDEAIDVADRLIDMLTSRPVIIEKATELSENKRAVLQRPEELSMEDLEAMTDKEVKLFSNSIEEITPSLNSFFQAKHQLEFSKSLLEKKELAYEEALQRVNHLTTEKERTLQNITNQKKWFSWLFRSSAVASIADIEKIDEMIATAQSDALKEARDVEELRGKIETSEVDVARLLKEAQEIKSVILADLEENSETPYLKKNFLIRYNQSCYNIRNYVLRETSLTYPIEAKKVDWKELTSL